MVAFVILSVLTAVCLMAASHAALAAPQPGDLSRTIQRLEADENALERRYPIVQSPTRRNRLIQLYRSTLSELPKSSFGSLGKDDRLDYLLLKHHLEQQIIRTNRFGEQVEETEPYLPFAKDLIALEEARRNFEPVLGAKVANTLNAAADQVRGLMGKAKSIERSKMVALRAAGYVDALRGHLDDWMGFYRGYDPVITWWCEAPHKELSDALNEYAKFLREQVAGNNNPDVIIGDPVGAAALREQLDAELIPYSPEELIAMAEKEYAWCEAEMIKASREMGHGDNWRAALEEVKQDHMAPGEQPEMIRQMAVEAIDWIEKNDFLTVPPLAKETWRMSMMSPQQQRVSPFFLGGELIQVSFPTENMEHDLKLMSLRGNNKHFSRATVHHELIPGHHLQQFIQSRHYPYRRMFGTPFWTEGWALYCEFRLWEMGFAQNAKNRVGMLFWRMHRCARIKFSLSFHLGKMTPEECIDFLVDKVGHERANAEAEVRRSFAGMYPPLYQAAYMLGAFQLRALHHETVGAKKMTDKEFNDAVLRNNNMPIAFLRVAMGVEAGSPEGLGPWAFRKP